MEEKKIGHPLLERKRLAAELRLKRIELELKRKELQAKVKEEKYYKIFGLSPLVTAILAGTLSVIGSIAVNYYQGKQGRELESAKSKATESLERQKQTHELILKMIGTDNPNQAAKNLQFLVQAGLIEDKDGRIAELVNNPNKIPVLPASTPTGIRTTNSHPKGTQSTPHTSPEKASLAVATALSSVSALVRIDSVQPLKISPPDLFNLTFKESGVVDDASMELFKQSLATLLPEIREDIQRMPSNVNTRIGDVLAYIRASLLASG
jgi:hypothetical protein